MASLQADALPLQSPAKAALPFLDIEAASIDNTHGSAMSAAAEPVPSALADEMDVDVDVNVDEAASPPQTPERQTARPATTRPARQTANGSGGGGGDVDDDARHTAAGPPPSPPPPDEGSSSPGTPGHIPPFAWDEFEARYERALADMDGEEAQLLHEFAALVEYFNAWASAASAHDDERAVKRLQTRERYVKIAEQTLSQRKQHLTEVVRAFQSALALLSQT